MSTDRGPKAMRIFEQVADLPPPQREAELDELCAGDADLRALVAAMLVADAEADEPFSGNGARWSEALGATVAPEPGAQPGRTIGPWRIVGELGRGGMGAVYEVQRSDGAYTQKAALKLIRSAADSPAARERFLRERQTLAQLQHPHIATLLDGGFSTDGDPYFVMEYVDGQPIDRWCDAHQLGLRERIALFGQVLEAVGYAHRNLVVHRDLKPSNLLVDAHSQVKLLDFGIAKQLEGTDATATSDRALTFEYASPEQLHAAPITTATDIWQLGIVLHRLLSGTHPFGLSRDTPLPKQLQMLEREPESLTRAAAQAGVEAAALRGGLSPTALAKELRGALSNVVQGCLRREPHQRYASADALADDLRRWLEYRPLRIAPPSRATSFRLWLRRNRGLATAGSVALLAVLAGSGGAWWQASEAKLQARVAERERNEAQRQTRIAQEQSDNAQAAMSFLGNALIAVDPNNTLDTKVSTRQLLESAQRELEKDDTLEHVVKQVVQRRLAITYANLGDLNAAIALFPTGLDQVQPTGRSDALAMADDLVNYSRILGNLGRYRDAIAPMQRAVELRQQYAPEDFGLQMSSHMGQAMVLYYDGDEKKALGEMERAGAMAEKMQNPSMNRLGEALNVYGSLARLHADLGEPERGVLAGERGLAFADRNGVAALSLDRAVLLLYLSDAQAMSGDHAAAEKTIRQAIAIDEHVKGRGGYQQAKYYGSLGATLSALGRHDEAVQAYQIDLDYSRAAGTDEINLAIAMLGQGQAYAGKGDTGKAMQLYAQAAAALDHSTHPAAQRALERVRLLQAKAER